jgi:hypothetical protein
MVLPVGAMEDSKDEQLRRTMAEISLLNNQLAQRKADAGEIRGRLSVRLGEIKTEALDQIRKAGIETQTGALGHPRIRYNLMLMAEIRAYMDRYAKKISYYRIACDRLSYLYQQADDDLKIVNALSGIKIDALMGQVEKVIDGYLPEAQTIVLQPDTLSVAPPEEVWKMLSAGG